MNDPTGALTYLGEALERSGKSSAIATILANMATAHEMLGDSEAAMSCANEAISRDSSFAGPFHLRSVLHDQAGRSKEAISDAKNALELGPDCRDYHLALAQLYASIGAVDEEKVVLGRATEQFPDDVTFWELTASVHLARNQWAQAVDSVGTVLKLSPNRGEFFGARAHALDKLGRYIEAIDDCDHAIELGADGVEYYYNTRASAWLNRATRLQLRHDNASPLAEADPRPGSQSGGQEDVSADECYAHAVADATKAIELDALLHVAYYNRGMAKGKTGDPGGGISDLSQAIDLYEHDMDYYFQRGVLYGHTGLYQKAIMDYDRALQGNPLFTQALHARGLMHSCLGDSQKAIRDIGRAVEIAPDDEVLKEMFRTMRGTS